MFCKNCGREIGDKTEICPECGVNAESDKQKKPFYKKWWFWVIIAAMFMIIIASGNSSEDTENEAASQNQNTVSQVQSDTVSQEQKPTVPEEFADNCPISVSANVADNIIGVPELQCNIKNNSEKEIAAIQMYFFPKNVYGEDINNIFTTNELYTDDVIGANARCSKSWQLLDDEIKSGDLYIYSVYFTDGTEWGDKDASVKNIKKYGLKVLAES